MRNQFPDQFLSNILQVKIKVGENLPCITFKSYQQAYKHSIQAFQNGRFALLEILSRRKRFSLQDISERCLFLSTTVHELKKLCEICLVRKSLRVSLPLFCIKGLLPGYFQKTAEHLSSDKSR